MPAGSAVSADWAIANVLRTRIITALAMAAIGLSALFWLPPIAFSPLAAFLFAGLGGWEASRLAGFDRPLPRALIGIVLLGAAAGLHLLAPARATPIVLGIGCGLWLILMCWLAIPGIGQRASAAWIAARILVLGVVVLTAWLALAWLQALSPWHVVMLLILIASADTFAYFTGRHFGGSKLAPRISPGKTRSGAVGGVLGAVVLTALAAAVLPASPFSPASAAILALVLTPVSVAGDLFISLLKRHRGLKDTSSLLPGHGGILDRFDSLAAALPFFALAVVLWGH